MKISQSWILAYDRMLDDTPTLASGSFIEYSKEWADFVFKNRSQEKQNSYHGYDIVIGPIANDRVGAQIRHFIEGDISFDTFLERLKYMKGITFQYFFGTKKAVQLLINKGLCHE